MVGTVPLEDVPVISADGARIYDMARRPLPGRTGTGKENIWVADRAGDRWGDPRPLDETVNALPHHWQFAVGQDGAVYFSSSWKGARGLFVSRPTGGRYPEPVPLGAPVSASGNEAMPFLAADGSYLLFQRNYDIYVSFRGASGAWTEPVALPAPDQHARHGTVPDRLARRPIPVLHARRPRVLGRCGRHPPAADCGTDVNPERMHTRINMHATRRITHAIAIVAGFATAGLAQPPAPVAPDLGKLADGKGAQVYNRTLTVGTEDGRSVARVDARAGDGGVLLSGIQMSEGIIEVDLKGKDVAQQSFLGVAFHVVDWTTLDAVYFRPFNFRGADAERRSHSVQYVAHPAYPWQRLRAERAGQFEKRNRTAARSERLVPRAHRRRGRPRRGVRERRREAESLGRGPRPGEERRRGAVCRQRIGRRLCQPDHYADRAGRSAARRARRRSSRRPRTGNLARLRDLVDADPKAVAARAPNGLTPLHAAALYGQQATAEFLVSKGADLNAVARHSGTPMDMAFEAKQDAMVAWLQARGARYTPLRFDITTITPSVRRIAFPWGMMNNVLAYSGADGAIVVDSGFSTRAIEELKKTITAGSTGGVRYVISTHGHSDHVAGDALAPSPQAVITAATLAAAAPGAASHARRRTTQGPDRPHAAGPVQRCAPEARTSGSSTALACTRTPT